MLRAELARLVARKLAGRTRRDLPERGRVAGLTLAGGP